MVYGDLQFFDIIIFAVIAIFIIYRLRSVLGKRTGFQKNTSQEQFVKKEVKQTQTNIPQLKENEQKLEVIYKNVSSFNHKDFLDGAGISGAGISGATTYKLSCLNYHSGVSINAGHYYADCLINGIWYRFNDAWSTKLCNK